MHTLEEMCFPKAGQQGEMFMGEKKNQIRGSCGEDKLTGDREGSKNALVECRAELQQVTV